MYNVYSKHYRYIVVSLDIIYSVYHVYNSTMYKTYILSGNMLGTNVLKYGNHVTMVRHVSSARELTFV